MKPFLKNYNINLFAKISKNTFFLCCFLVLFLNKNSFADIVRATTFDDRVACEKSHGSWRDFGNSCANKCIYKFDKYAVCSYSITFGCDCGKNRCLYEDKCVLINEYKKIHEQKIIEEELIANEFKQRRLKIAQKFQNDYLSKLSGIYGSDPNKYDPYRRNVERELPPNTFKSTNRMLIYNHIIKKHNDKILENAKINAEKNLKNVNNQQQNELNESPKLVKLLNDSQENINPIQNNDIAKNSPIILKPIDEETKDNNLENFQESTSNKIKNIIDKVSKIAKEDDKKDGDIANIPPVYVKKQNGEADFKDGDVIDNIDNVPQFIN